MTLTHDLIQKVEDAAQKAADRRLPITTVEVRPYMDWTGQDAVQILVILPEDLPDEKRAWEIVKPIDRAIHDAVASVSELFPYTRFVKLSELAVSED